MPMVTVVVKLSVFISLCNRTLDAVENGQLTDRNALFSWPCMAYRLCSLVSVFAAYILYLNSLAWCQKRILYITLRINMEGVCPFPFSNISIFKYFHFLLVKHGVY